MKFIIIPTCLFVLLSITSCKNSTKKVEEDSESISRVQTPSTLFYDITGTLPHDTTAFTQGLEVYNGKIFEGTGIAGKTSLRVLNSTTGEIEAMHSNYGADIFGEGITILNNNLYQLTYKNTIVYKYNVKELDKPIATSTWSKEGWGCTNDGVNLIISDGSSQLHFVDPVNMNILNTTSVRDNYGPVDQLNELEYIKGYIFANKWYSDKIYKIDPKNGEVVGVLHFDGVLKQYAPDFIPTTEEVLNGIAWDKESDILYVTGKNWPVIFKIKLK